MNVKKSNKTVTKNCKWCKIEYEVYQCFSNSKFCSVICKREYDYCFKSGFFSKEAHDKSTHTQKTKKIGWYNSDTQKRITLQNKSLNKGIFSSKAKNNSIKTNKKIKTNSFYNRVLNRISRDKAFEKLKKNRSSYFMGTNFDSNLEMTFAQKIYLNFGIIPENNKNCHIWLEGGEIDFYLFNQFIEIHVFHGDKQLDRSGISLSEYRKKRKYILDRNGFNGQKLIILQTTKDMDLFIKRQKIVLGELKNAC